MKTAAGKVYLVGTGPGDAELLTVKALRLMQTADVVIHDRLVSAGVMQLVPAKVARIYAGKSTGCHTLRQEDINRLLVDQALAGQRVVRLKGGDPFIFGRGSEEARALAAAGIDFEIVPGITAAQACAAYAGIPLTHRGLARGVQFITGHRSNNDALQIDPATLADPEQTLVVYMGLATLPQLVETILAAGRTAATPAAIVERGTTAQQRTVITTLSGLQAAIREQDIRPPAMLVIGEVVTLAHELDWFMPVMEEAELQYA